MTLGVAFLASFLVMQVVLYVLYGVVLELERGKLVPSAIPGLVLEAILSWMSGLTEVSSYRRPEVLMWLSIPAALALGQVAFISPLVGPLRLAPTGRSMRWTVVGASVMVGGLTCILLWSLLWLVARYAQVSSFGSLGAAWGAPYLLFPSWFICGALWTWALRRSIASRDPDTISRFARRMLAGTCVELVLALPLYLLVRRRSECMCATPNFWSIVVGLLGLVWLCGPAGVLLLTKGARRRWRAGVCAHCGYPLRAGNSRCSECGHATAG